ncbi:MAG: hypothetical protein QOH48_2427 [Actinomycetota bacterium]|nr:hypothetical protein [Actinomycetota bacterium]
MSEQIVRRLGLAGWAACVALSLAGVSLLLPYRTISSLNVPQQWQSAFIGLAFGSVGGFLVSRRPNHRIPWIFLVIGLSQSVSAFSLYGQALLAGGSHSQWADVLAWLETWSWAPGFILIPTLLLQLFPTGEVLSPRWRWLARATLIGLGLALGHLGGGPVDRVPVLALDGLPGDQGHVTVLRRAGISSPDSGR